MGEQELTATAVQRFLVTAGTAWNWESFRISISIMSYSVGPIVKPVINAVEWVMKCTCITMIPYSYALSIK